MELKNPYLHSKVIVPAVILAALIVYLTMGISMGPLILGNKTSESFFSGNAGNNRYSYCYQASAGCG